MTNEQILEDKKAADEFNAKNYRFLVNRAFLFLKKEQENIEEAIMGLHNTGETKAYLNEIWKYKQNFIPDISIDDTDNFVTQVIFQVSDKIDINNNNKVT